MQKYKLDDDCRNITGASALDGFAAAFAVFEMSTALLEFADRCYDLATTDHPEVTSCIALVDVFTFRHAHLPIQLAKNSGRLVNDARNIEEAGRSGRVSHLRAPVLCPAMYSCQNEKLLCEDD